MERFLRYSLQKNRKIRLVLMLDGGIVQKTAAVQALEGDLVTLLLTGKKTPVTVPVTDILSCDYARGDHGEE